MSEGNSRGDDWSQMPTLLAAAHELKAPLVLIRQLALQLQEQNASDLSSQRIKLTAERSLHLLDGLTRSARLQDAFFEIEPIHVTELYESIIDEMTPLTRALGQSIDIDGGRAATVIGNRSLLRSVLIGLCDNALTHNDSAKPVLLGVRQMGERVELSVRDFGPRTDKLLSIRKNLGKTPQPLSSRPRSSGLGLLIAEQFAAHMDASLNLTRHHDVGSTFSLSLPRSRQLSFLEIA